MFLSMFTYSSLATKVRAMLGHRLTKHDYTELLQKRSVRDVAAYLKQNTYYKTVLSEINENAIHRGQLEEELKKALVNDYVKLFKFIRGNVKDFLKITFSRYEIEDLKLLLRVLNTGEDVHILYDSVVFLKKYNSIDIEKLIESKNMQQFIENLKGSVYYDILSPFMVNTQYLNLFSIEMSLDMYYFSNIWKQKEKLLSGRDEDFITHSLGSEIDILNILWIYRCKKYYNTPKEIIYSYVIPHRYKLSRAQLMSMVEARDAEEVKNIIYTTKYSEIFKSNDVYSFEHNFTYYVYRLNEYSVRNNPFSIASLMAYLHLKEIEIRNIISVIEGIRYQLQPEQIKKYLVYGEK